MTTRTLLLLLLAGGAGWGDAAAQSTLPPMPRIVGADVEDVGPYRPDIARRSVRFGISLADAAACGPATGPVEYGLLIDADRSKTTGVSYAALDPLGIDARIVMRCDPRTGRFTSPIGNVRVRADAGVSRIEIETTVGRLPSVDFFWSPYAAVNGRLWLLADRPRHSRWAILERSIP
jgi:hypothetical protein